MWNVFISWMILSYIKSIHCTIPVVKPYKPDITLNSGEELKIECPIVLSREGTDANYPSNLMYEWNIKGLTEVSVQMNPKYSFIENNRILKLMKPVTSEDSGKYVCKGVTGFGSREVVFNVEIIDSLQERLCAEKNPKDSKLDPPCFVDPQMRSGKITIRKEVGSTVKLPCDAIGSPQLKYLWLTGKTIANWIQNVEGTRGPVITIRNLKSHYTGQYTCQVRNKAGSLNYTYQLIVTDPSNNSPKILTDLSNYTFRSKENISISVEIECECKEPIIKWLKRVDNFDSSNKEQSNGLVLPNAKDSEKGELYVTLDTGVSTKRIQPNLFKTLLNMESVETQQSGKYVVMAINKIVNLKNFEYKVVYITIEPDKDAIGIKNNLVVYIAVPMVILASSLGVIIYCCFRRHSSGYGRSASASRSSHRCANGSALPSLTNGSNTGSEKLKSPSTTSTGMVVGYNPYKYVYPSQAPSSNYDQYSVLSVSHSSQTPPQYFQPQNTVAGAQFNNANPYHHNNGYVAVPISHYQA
uniref:NOU-DARAKE n=1 Tax=Dugesia japonica TaxID=6161 RepID=Q8I0V7_DUGJA|nr:NOU-DARAKE [Dugesia japonica]